MDQIVTIALANNVALLLVLSIIYEFSYVVPAKYKRFRPFVNGVLISIICLIIMSMPFTLAEGIVFDTRSILISVTALIFGPIPALLTVITASVTRIILGGAGTLTGLAVIFSSALIGLAWRRWAHPLFVKLHCLSIYLMSLIVHGVMLLCMLLISYPTNLLVLSQIAAPVIIIYPLASVVIGVLLLRQQERRRIEIDLQESEEKHRRLFETLAQGVVYQDPEGRILSANPAAQRILGMSLDQMQDKTSVDPAWQTINEDGVSLTGPEHPTMVAIRTGQPFGPMVIGVINYQLQDYVWLIVNAIPLYQPGEKTPSKVYSTFQDITAERKANQNYQRLFDQMVDAFAVHEIICDQLGNPVDYRFLAVNPAFERMTSLRNDQIVGRRMLEIIPDTEPRFFQIYGRVALTGEAITFEDYSSSDDKYYAISAYQPAANQFAVTFTDITKRIKAENALKASEHKYFSYIDNAPDAVFVTDENGLYVEANQAASEITGYSNEELMRMSILDIIAEDSQAEALTHFKTMQQTNSMKAELQYVHKDGSKRWWTANAVKLSENRYLGFSNDITDRKKAEYRLLHLSYHDHLTDLYNRAYYDLTLKTLDTPDNLPLSIIVGDINGLKLINDAFGHQEGDHLIRETAKLLQKNCRAQDILARIGGDEFSIIMPKTCGSDAYEIIKRFEKACIDYNSQISNEAFHISISLGIGTKEVPETELNDVIITAQDYMNQRKLLESKSSHSAIIASIKATMFANSQETEDHAERLVTLSKQIGLSIGLSKDELNHLELFSMLHDIGKVGISDQILNKVGKLTDDDWVELKKHPAIGYRIAMSTPELAPIADLILSHHERWDGTGYPQNLKGEQIPLLARILSVVDSFDAMTNDRSYRKAMSTQYAIEEIERYSGSQFDPTIARLFIGLVQKQ